MRTLLPSTRLPLTTGFIHFMRKVDPRGYIELLNEQWRVGPKWLGVYVRATLTTAKETLTIWHKPDDQADWRLLKSRICRLKESVHDLVPQFRRNSARGRDYLPA
ncbi:MAG: hypothetical protein HYZ81_19055 [Nitrospinae bacterium]|nr:hypothetical protein [Nitrospinota bacterium]